MSAQLRLFNSLTRKVEPFQPIDPTMVRLYSCGPTVYNYAHLGNLRAYVFTDTLSRVLRWKGYPLRHVINITDVGHLTSDADAGDDKMEAAARAQAKSIWDVAAHYTDAFKRNLADLNIREPDIWSVATQHIPEMIAFAERIAPAHCYEIDSGLYFDVATVPRYGSLARAHDDQGEARIDPVAGKRHPQDFAIWRKSAPGENRQMEWDSPWGRGAPGWHLECSVMSHKYLSAPFGGAPFDIHTGGIDHREIHHPNEIAQNQAYCGCTAAEPDFTGARFWMHNNFLVDRAGKMSKSSGEFLTLDSIVARGVHPLAYRLLCLGAHYRSELDYSLGTLGAALTRLSRIANAIADVRDRAAHEQRQVRDRHPAAQAALDAFDAAISSDLMTPQALPLLEQVLADRATAASIRLQTAMKMDTVLGLDLDTLDRNKLSLRPAIATLTEHEAASLFAQRLDARARKEFTLSDTLRAKLNAGGVEVMDGATSRWEWRADLAD